MLRNTKTGMMINPESIIRGSIESGGITYFDGNDWVFLASDFLEEVETTKSSEIYTGADKTSFPFNSIVGNLSASSDGYTKNDIIKDQNFSYYFGINSLSTSKRVYKNACAYITKDIAVHPGKLLYLKADYSEGTFGSIEFYISDGNKEYSIIPMNHCGMIKNEKLFYGMQPRFGGESFEVYKDMVLQTCSIEEINFSEEALFTVNYLPTDGFYLVANTTAVKIKIIMRMYDLSGIPPRITSMRLLEVEKDGGE